MLSARPPSLYHLSQISLMTGPASHMFILTMSSILSKEAVMLELKWHGTLPLTGKRGRPPIFSINIDDISTGKPASQEIRYDPYKRYQSMSEFGNTTNYIGVDWDGNCGNHHSLNIFADDNCSINGSFVPMAKIKAQGKGVPYQCIARNGSESPWGSIMFVDEPSPTILKCISS